MHDNVTMPHLNVEVFAQGLPKDLAIRSRSAPGHEISATWGRENNVGIGQFLALNHVEQQENMWNQIILQYNIFKQNP